MLLLQTGGERPRRSYLPTDSEQEAERKTNFMSLDLETKASEREGVRTYTWWLVAIMPYLQWR